MGSNSNVQFIGNSFIQAFYQTLISDTVNTAKFYKDNGLSQLSHDLDDGVENNILTSFTTIKDYYTNCKLAGASINLERGTFDIQACGESSVLIVITGHLTTSEANTIVKQFIHTFILARDLSIRDVKKQGYFIQNEVMRILNDVNSSSSTDTDGNEEEKLVNEIEEKLVVENDEVSNYSGNGAGEEKEEINSTSPDENTTESKEDVSQPSVVSKKPSTWASRLMTSSQMESSSISSTTNAAPTTQKSKKKVEAEATSGATSQSTNGRSGAGYGGSSLYLTNINATITQSDLKNYFNRYNFPIAKINCVQSRGFAFIDFPNIQAADVIISDLQPEKNITISGVKIRVEKKVVKYRRFSPRGGNGGRRRKAANTS